MEDFYKEIAETVKEGQPHIYRPLKAMRRKCLDCCCGSSKEVELCPVESCALFPYRRGRHPTMRKREMSEEEKNRAREQLRNLRK